LVERHENTGLHFLTVYGRYAKSTSIVFRTAQCFLFRPILQPDSGVTSSPSGYSVLAYSLLVIS